MIRNKNRFLVNYEIHYIDTRQQANFHQPTVSVAIYQMGEYYLGVKVFNPLNPELNPICHLLALLGTHHIFHVSRIRVKSLTLRLLMSYIYIYIYIWSTHS